MYLYKEMLDPDLYDDPFVSRFVENLLEPEVDTISDIETESLSEKLMAPDDMQLLAINTLEQAKEAIVKTGKLIPNFSLYLNSEHKINFKFSFTSDQPSSEDVDSYLSACKSLSFIRNAQCVFFHTIQPIKNNKVVQKITPKTSWGILVIGSSLRGHCFTQVCNIVQNEDSFHFEDLHQEVSRDNKCSLPFGQFFTIEDYHEMEAIVKQIPRLMIHSHLDEKVCIKNFATTLKSLAKFGYKK